ncbi:tRNA-splicing endonuclease subunit Sen2 [Onthophagus taurus]|uniref:tRNA-splicing endonuclease subunit Sen2 n=1 Tax=Onthophagus taurus TaxID=166361 RepID=UPI0039BDC9A2
MNLISPKKKFNKNLVKTDSILPFREKNDLFEGYFNGFSVIITNKNDVKELVEKGCFGKPEFSRAVSNHDPECVILRKRQFEYRKKYPIGKDLKKIIIVPDSESDDDYFTDLKPFYDFDKSLFSNNSLILSLHEAYFLAVELKCLKIANVENPWDEFKNINQYFIIDYAVYLHFRLKNWVIKSGLKFGCDFLLYKQGPAFYHASYVVIIDVINEKLDRILNLQRRSMEYKNLIGLYRLAETTGKELLICQVILPENVNLTSCDCLNCLCVNEVLFRRFIPSN